MFILAIFREHISVASLLNLLRKRRVMIENVKVSKVREKLAR
jgi:hypothetical protein